MRYLALVIAATAAVTSLSSLPADAFGLKFPTVLVKPGPVRPNNPPHKPRPGTQPALFRNIGDMARPLCLAPRILENVCVAWAPGNPGTFVGPCIKYQLQCVSVQVLH